ncbi:MAG: DUF4276 family protein [Chloroflexi bacterium]|nr:DUF4276 family protein [Chloroflexota bacterium]
MVKAHIYLEGGGGKELNARCREGFNRLFKKCGFERMPKLTASGSRESVFGDFKTAHAGASGQNYVAMLVDSEDPVKDIQSPWAHLIERDGWQAPPGATEEQVLLMTTCMETWIAADSNALSSHYGQCLQENALPSVVDLEGRDRHTIQDNLRHATRNCKGPYKKGAKSYELLGKLNPDIIEHHLPSFKRARDTLNGKL